MAPVIKPQKTMYANLKTSDKKKTTRQKVNGRVGLTPIETRVPTAEHPLLQVQRRFGNRYVQRMIALSKEYKETEVTPAVEKTIQHARGAGQALNKGVRVLTQLQRMYGNSFIQRVIQAGAQGTRIAGLAMRRKETLVQKEPAVTAFTRRVRLYDAATRRRVIGVLQGGRQVHILARGGRRHHVRVEEGPLRNRLGYVNTGDVVIPQATSITFSSPRPVRLVFFQNPERIGTTITSVGVGMTRRATALRQMGAGGRILTPRRRRIIPAGRPVYLRGPHPTTYFRVSARFGSTYQQGFVRRSDLRSDISRRRIQRQFFLHIAGQFARQRDSIYVSPRNQRCIDRAYPIEYSSANDILRAIAGAANCTGSLIEEIHIVAHGGRHGIPGTGDLQHYYGLYIRSYLQNVSVGGMTTRMFAQRVRTHLSQRVQVRIHACLTGEQQGSGQPGFAEELATELRASGLSRARVHGLLGAGRADRPGPWRTYPGRAR